MLSLDPQDLAARCGGTWHGPAAGPVAGFGIDTRSLHPGEMFVALRSGHRDGHDFLAAAREAGAAAALVERADPGVALPQLVVADTLAALHAMAREQRRRFTGPVVGVTGSAGKTSTKDLLSVLIGGADEVLATEGNLNNQLGVPLTLLRLDLAQHRAAVVEAGISQPGDMETIAALIAPDVAVITMVGAAHLDGLGSVAGVAVEKARLAAHLRAGGVSVFPASCLEHDAFRKLGASALVVVPTNDPGASGAPCRREVPVAVRHEGGATLLCVTWGGVVEEFEMRRVTGGMATNAALALIVALHLGIDSDTLRPRLVRWRPAAMRGEIHRMEHRIVYLDCYNANPASMSDALEGFLAVAGAEHPRLYIVGCMEELGPESAELHRAVGGRWPLRERDRLFVFGTQADELAAGARTVAPGADIRINPDRSEAAETVRGFRGAVFIKGSRRYALEGLLDGQSPDHGAGREVAA